jgi:hypothetical protein
MSTLDGVVGSYHLKISTISNDLANPAQDITFGCNGNFVTERSPARFRFEREYIFFAFLASSFVLLPF